MINGGLAMENQSEQNRMKRFGRAVQHLMDKRGHTLRSFAKEISYTEAKLLEILHGQVNPTRAEKVKFAKALGLRPPEDRRQTGNWDPFSDLPDDKLDSLFLDSVPDDGPKLPDAYKF